MAKTATLPIEKFETAKEWRSWLKKNHLTSEGVWLRIFKKDSNEKTVTYAEALDEALCFGWVDSQKKSYDAKSFLQKFGPRRAKSIWSKVNCAHIERLIQEKKMTAAGLKQVNAAKEDGRWDQAYEPPSKATIPDDFLKALQKNKKAKAFFETLNKTNLYSIAWRLQTAKKSETREKRMIAIIEMLAEGKKFHGK